MLDIYFCPVLENKIHIAGAIDCHVLSQTVPEELIKICEQFILFLKFIEESSHRIFVGTPLDLMQHFQNIPNLSNQWILLLTDTEFTDTEKELFEKYKQVGKTYVLDNQYGRTTPVNYEKLSQLEMGAI